MREENQKHEIIINFIYEKEKKIKAMYFFQTNHKKIRMKCNLALNQCSNIQLLQLLLSLVPHT
jgi:hypothetical protein